MHYEIFLQPGEYYFGSEPERIRTLLGSCIAVTMWHPVLHQGGMVHCLLPSRGKVSGVKALSGRFVDEGIRWLLQESVRAGIEPGQCHFKLFGGSNMFAAFGVPSVRRTTIGEDNAAKAEQMLERLGLPVYAKDFGGTVHRTLVFDLSTGDVWVRYGEPVATGDCRESGCA
jgi:chemotaxis protein CheD